MDSVASFKAGLLIYAPSRFETFFPQPNDLWLQQEFEAADSDGNGSISKEEFVQAAKENVKIQVRCMLFRAPNPPLEGLPIAVNHAVESQHSSGTLWERLRETG